jgi:hypothetical protein
MITKYKLFENTDNIKDKLMDQLDQNYIENNFDQNYSIGVEEIIDMSPSIVFDNINKEAFIQNFIDNDIQDRTLDDFGEYDYKHYIEKEMDDEDKEAKILQLYNDKNFIEEDEKETEYSDYMLADLDEDELREVIEDANMEDDCIEKTVRGWYKGHTVKDILDEFYGDITGEQLYKQFRRYIDDDKIIKEWIDGEDYEYKEEFVRNNIEYTVDIQEHLLSLDPKNVLLLFKLFEEEGGSDNIGDKYDFQKKYIEQYLIKKKYDSKNEERKSYLRASVLKKLNDNFNLDSAIEEEYEDDMWMVNSEKYNL